MQVQIFLEPGSTMCNEYTKQLLSFLWQWFSGYSWNPPNKLMIHQTKFPGKNTFVTRKIKSCWKKNNSSIAKLTPFSKNCHHIETSQSICISNQFTGFYMIRVFIKRCFTADYMLRQFFSWLFFQVISSIVCKSISAI